MNYKDQFMAKSRSLSLLRSSAELSTGISFGFDSGHDKFTAKCRRLQLLCVHSIFLKSVILQIIRVEANHWQQYLAMEVLRERNKVMASITRFRTLSIVAYASMMRSASLEDFLYIYCTVFCTSAAFIELSFVY